MVGVDATLHQGFDKQPLAPNVQTGFRSDSLSDLLGYGVEQPERRLGGVEYGGFGKLTLVNVPQLQALFRREKYRLVAHLASLRRAGASSYLTWMTGLVEPVPRWPGEPQ